MSTNAGGLLIEEESHRDLQDGTEETSALAGTAVDDGENAEEADETSKQAKKQYFSEETHARARKYNIFNRCWYSRREDVNFKTLADEDDEEDWHKMSDAQLIKKNPKYTKEVLQLKRKAEKEWDWDSFKDDVSMKALI